MTLAVHELSLSRSGRKILTDISLDLHPGEILGLIGANGSGKSTLLRAMAGLWPPSAGSIVIDGGELAAMPRPEIARRIAYVPQETVLMFDFSVRETVLMGRYAHRGRFQRETKEDVDAADDALRRTDAIDLADRLVTTLSGGERQRVLIARSLATRAPILLLDEPTANLDVNHALEILDLCQSLARDGSSIVIATHDLNSVYRFVDRAALIEGGRIAAIGSADVVLTEENLARAFHVRSETLHNPDGARMLAFHRLKL